jgi:hypothetical protein
MRRKSILAAMLVAINLVHAETGGKCPHELESAAAKLQVEQREAEANLSVAAVVERIPSLGAAWEELHAFMAQVQSDIDEGNLDEWKAMNNLAANKIIARCRQWWQQAGLTKGQQQRIDRFESTCRKTFF